jgi:hypothetical protein
MSRYALRLPDSLFEAAKALAEQEHTSLNQLFVTAIAEKVSALRTESYFRERAAHADADAFAAVLEKIKQRGGTIVPGDEVG